MNFQIPAIHPALPGHFPGHPVVPGVLILDRVLEAVADNPQDYRVLGIRKLKFLRPLLPAQACEVVLATARDGRLRFECLQDGERIAEGNLLVSTETAV